MRFPRSASFLGASLAASLSASLAAAQSPAVNQFGNPQTLAPSPTRGVIDEQDLKTRLYQFADDSMLGRQIGRIGNKKGTDYIAAEVKRLGLLPAGDNGTYFQTLPYRTRKFTDHSRLTANGNPLTWNVDWVAVPGQRAPRPISGVEVVFGGTAGDTSSQISAAQAAGKFVVLRAASAAPMMQGPAGGRGFAGGRGGQPAPLPARLADAAAVATVDLDALSPAARAALNEPTVASGAPQAARGGGGRPGATPQPVDSIALLKAQLAAYAPTAIIRLTSAAAQQLFAGKAIETLQAGARGGTVTASLDFVETPSEWARNVVAIIPGSDPILKNQYVAIGAHNDHVGTTTPVDKDSIRAYNIQKNRALMAHDMIDQPGIYAGITVNMDSIRRIYPTPRLDSINNGADDDGSGSMGVLEIAEAIAAMPVKPKRSTLFVWHTGEEGGLIGSAFFTANPTVPIDSVVAQINIDMIGRGRADDIPGGGPDYLGAVGSFFDSKDLGDQVVATNKKQARRFKLDYRYDSTMSWSGYNNIYGRSDHFNYARQGVPIAFFFTGLHGDYHQRSDEPEFIDYPHYARITNYLRDLLVDVSNGPRPRLNGTKPQKPKPIG